MMPAQVPAARKPWDWLLGVPNDLGAALRMLPQIAENTKSMAADTARLREVSQILERITKDTGPMSERIEVIADSMPVLVEVQGHLAELPETMARLEQRLDALTVLIERMLASVQAVGENVGEIQESIGPVSRLARRLPGQRRRDRAAAAGTDPVAAAEPAETAE
jgi:methyl-accepting chemotaxis protein